MLNLHLSPTKRKINKQNKFTLRRTGVANFAGTIKIVTMFIKKIFKDSKKLKELQIM